MPPSTPLTHQACDLVIHTHCEALSEAEQRAGAAELGRFLALAERGAVYGPDMRMLAVNALTKVSCWGGGRKGLQ